ncbi:MULTISPECIES: ribonuclease M5 [Shouchella]|uniref:Ribonuclease M5 n=2 Tax=Shouchella TaxID=2893057 RepID=A0ABY7WE38_9BACI|nr:MULTISPECIES: ribonuclease M5 [Shouchella]MED4126859.1 ribonuclease M5 [Shouchella miscanthi]WDF05894.1 ribonuclease M5 [Shouchella hunanensis]
MKIKEIIVVEGRSDTVAIKRAVDADTIETNGSAIGEDVLKRIELAYERRGVIILTDPDYPGTRIRRIVSERVPGSKHAFIPKAKAMRNNRTLGVEHASDEAIRQALEDVRSTGKDHYKSAISVSDLIKAGLLSGAGAKKKREALGERLAIGYANGKQLKKRLDAFEITIEEFAQALKDIEVTEELRT